DFIEEWEKYKSEKYGRNRNEEEYHREPFAADVGEGKGGKIYNAHSYHTKVPHKAIMRYLLHYTDPGDIILDGFSGSGMTGIACDSLNNPKEIKELGYRIINDEVILDERIVSRVGKRFCILNDLSPAATFISATYNVKSQSFIKRAKEILEKVQREFSWTYETFHNKDKNEIGHIHYTIWSDVFYCSSCNEELIFWEVGLDHEKGRNKTQVTCYHCQAEQDRRTLKKVWVQKYDGKLDRVISIAKQVPALINYSFNGRRYNKKPDIFDLELINRIEQTEIDYWYPVQELVQGYNTSQPIQSHGFTHVH